MALVVFFLVLLWSFVCFTLYYVCNSFTVLTWASTESGFDIWAGSCQSHLETSVLRVHCMFNRFKTKLRIWFSVFGMVGEGGCPPIWRQQDLLTLPLIVATSIKQVKRWRKVDAPSATVQLGSWRSDPAGGHVTQLQDCAEEALSS